MSVLINLVNINEIPSQKGLAKEITHEGRLYNLAVFEAEGQPLVMINNCPHKDIPINDGYFDGEAVVCPWHDWVFSVDTGERIGCPEKKIIIIPHQHNRETGLISIQADDLPPVEVTT